MIILFALLFQAMSSLPIVAKAEDLTICPLCNEEGTITCPLGFKAICLSSDESEPKCLFLENRYVSGCWKFIGIKKLDLDIGIQNMPPSTMVKIIGGGETYTLNRETIGCRKL